jgi:hypothetical protein
MPVHSLFTLCLHSAFNRPKHSTFQQYHCCTAITVAMVYMPDYEADAQAITSHHKQCNNSRCIIMHTTQRT